MFRNRMRLLPNRGGFGQAPQQTAPMVNTSAGNMEAGPERMGYANGGIVKRSTTKQLGKACK